MKSLVAVAALLAGAVVIGMAQAQPTWITTWAASAHGPYPSGNPSAQPNLSFAFPAAARGARDQTLRLTVRPDAWGPETRVRLTNAWGTQPVTFDAVTIGLQMSGAALVPGTNHDVTFGGSRRVVVEPGAVRWSDPVRLRFVDARRLPDLVGRKLAVSLSVAGESGPMTWHAKALTTSYVTRQGAGNQTAAEDDAAFPFTTASWFFVDAVDMRMPGDTKVIVAFGDSITDGTASTLNGDDRWPDVLSRRVHRAFGDRAVVVNAGIGGNQIAGPASYSATSPVPGGPSAAQRLERDVLSLSGVSTVIWLEGINDLSRLNGGSIDAIMQTMTDVVGRIRAGIPGVRVIGGTVISSLRSTNGAYGSPEVNAARQALNTFIRTSKVFDAVVDFDAATIDPATGELRREFVPDSTTGGAGDRLHPNRAGYLAMGEAVDLAMLGLGRP
jgi:lysophospholipase L1-like esterase